MTRMGYHTLLVLEALCNFEKLAIQWFRMHHIYFFKGLGSRRGEIGPAIEMHTDLKYVYMVYFIEKNRNFIGLLLNCVNYGFLKKRTLCKFCSKSNDIYIAM